MNNNDIENRIRKLERQVFGMTQEQEQAYRQDCVSDYVIARIKFLIEQLNPNKPRYEYHLGLIQSRFGLNELEWTHALNVIDAIKRGARPDFDKSIKPRAE